MVREIEFRRYWELIRRRWKIITILPLIAALTSGLVSFYIIKPVFRTSTTLIVGKKSVDFGQAIGQMLDYSVLMANQQLTKTYAAIAKSYTVEQNVINALQLPYTVGELNRMITVSPVRDTEILQISVTYTDPVLAASIANAVAQEFSKAVIDIKKVDSVSIVDKAMTPVNSIKPNIHLNVLIVIVVSLIASVGLVFLLDYFDRTKKSTSEKSSDIEKLLGIPVLGIIPDYQIGKQR